MESTLAEMDTIWWSQWLRPGDHVVCSHMSAEPQALLKSLSAASALPGPYTIDLGVPFSSTAELLDNRWTLHVLGGMGAARHIARTRPLVIDRVDYASAFAAYRHNRRSADVVLVSLAQAADGTLSLGASHSPAIDAARQARHVIAEINEQAPALRGALWPRDIPLSASIHCNYALASPVSMQASPTEQQIASRLGELVPDAACLQVGIGTLPSAVLGQLRSHRHLGIHSGMLTDALFSLLTCGAVDHCAKPSGMQHVVTGCVYGSTELYQAVTDNPQVKLAHPSQTHALSVLATIPRFTAINSAIEIDLLGRVNAESVLTRDGSHRYVGGLGGLADCIRGALAAPEGRSIIALPSQAAGKSRTSRIVPSLSGHTTLGAELADTIVTEHGVATLRGLSSSERRDAIIAIAAPEDRSRLSQASI